MKKRELRGLTAAGRHGRGLTGNFPCRRVSCYCIGLPPSPVACSPFVCCMPLCCLPSIACYYVALQSLFHRQGPPRHQGSPVAPRRMEAPEHAFSPPLPLSVGSRLPCTTLLRSLGYMSCHMTLAAAEAPGAWRAVRCGPGLLWPGWPSAPAIGKGPAAARSDGTSAFRRQWAWRDLWAAGAQQVIQRRTCTSSSVHAREVLAARIYHGTCRVMRLVRTFPRRRPAGDGHAGRRIREPQ